MHPVGSTITIMLIKQPVYTEAEPMDELFCVFPEQFFMFLLLAFSTFHPHHPKMLLSKMLSKYNDCPTTKFILKKYGKMYKKMVNQSKYF